MLLELLAALIVIAALLIMFTHVPSDLSVLIETGKYLFVAALDKVDDK